jgi:hypothetical protein
MWPLADRGIEDERAFHHGGRSGVATDDLHQRHEVRRVEPVSDQLALRMIAI